MTASFEPFLLEPIVVPRIWGGDRLLTEIHTDLTAPLDQQGVPLPVGETWEVSDVDDDTALHSRIASGSNRGLTVREWILKDPEGALGPAGIGRGQDGTPQLPLLFKYIDAREDLSVQVHPSDRVLQEIGRPGRGKSEAWVILDAQPGSRLIVGFEDGWDFARYLEAARRGDGDQGLRAIEVSRGDIVDLPAGLVHAIGGGILLAEIQQSSDITWRLYDWGRMGLDGKPRELHLDQCALVEPPTTEPPCPLPRGSFRSGLSSRSGWDRPIDGDHFRLEVAQGVGPYEIERRTDRFGSLALLEGDKASLRWGHERLQLRPGSVVFAPALAPQGLELSAKGPVWAIWMEAGGAGA